MPTQSTKQTAFWGIYRLWNRLSNRHCETWSRGKNVPRESPKSPEIRIHSRQRDDEFGTGETLTSKRVKIYGCMCVTRTSVFHSLQPFCSIGQFPWRNVDKQDTKHDRVWSLQAHICTSKLNAFHIKGNLGCVVNGKSACMGICFQLSQLNFREYMYHIKGQIY